MSLLFILQSTANTFVGILPMIIMFVIIYFFFIRPQAQKQKEQAAFQKDLSNGDMVVTGSGIIGKITKMDDKEVVLESENKTHIKVVRSAISKEMTDLWNK